MAWKDHKHRVVRWYIWSVVLGTCLLTPPASLYSSERYLPYL
jgi:hypothetical protein